MLMKLFEIRTILLKAYQKARFIVNPIVKFLVSFFVFSGINDFIGYDTRFTGTTITLLLSVICALTPNGILVFFAMVLTLVHVFSASLYLAALLLMLFIVMYGFMIRFSPKEAIVAVLLPLLAKYNFHYCIPMVLGCISTPLSILPCSCGVIIYFILDIVKAAAARQFSSTNIDDVVQFYNDIADAVMANKPMFIMLVVFALVIIVVFVIRQFSFDYAFIISIAVGMVTNLLGFLVADLRFDVTVNIGVLILMTIVCGAIAYLAEFVKRVLDYSAVEHIQFEDDDYYYYVKAVPKVNVSIPRHNIKHIRDSYNDDTESESDDAKNAEESSYTLGAGFADDDDAVYVEETLEEIEDEDFGENTPEAGSGTDETPGENPYRANIADFRSYGLSKMNSRESSDEADVQYLDYDEDELTDDDTDKQ